MEGSDYQGTEMEGSDQSNRCAICLSGMSGGGGQAIFTAECAHTFHFHCITTSVAHGHFVCPLCNAQWRDLPVLRPSAPPTEPAQPLPLRQPMHGVQPRQAPVRHAMQPPFQPDETQAFDDDEPVEAQPGHGGQRQEASASSGRLVVKTHTEYSAIARDSSHDNFAVLVHVTAPGMVDGEAAGGGAPRAPLDLVTVLDVSGSMGGAKLALLKQAMGFVIDNLGPHDRLSVVSFSSSSRRVSRLLRMSDAGKGLAKGAVESLTACGGTNIAAGLRTAAKVLDERRHRNAVSSVILLSDGQDNYTMTLRRASDPNYEALVPLSFTRAGTGGGWLAPVHTFGFGNDHDAAAMHVIAEATGGTFSYIENEAAIQDGFAQCIGGLLSVVVQEARIRVACGHPGVRICSVKSGRYESCVDEDGRAASINVGELYADEERRFLLFLAVPKAEATDGETALIKVSCSYRDAAGGADVDVSAEDTVVARPEHAVDAEERSVEVERERVRVEAAEDIAAARAAAERGAHQEAVEILERRQQVVAQSEAARGGDPMSLALEAELREMRGRVASRESYARSGRAFVLAGVSMHAQQRANSSHLGLGARRVVRSMLASSNAAAPDGTSGEAEAGSYATPAMRAMLLRSRRAREETAASDMQQQQPRGGGDVGRSEPEEAEQQ